MAPGPCPKKGYDSPILYDQLSSLVIHIYGDMNYVSLAACNLSKKR